jgi:hypothetical protein
MVMGVVWESKSMMKLATTSKQKEVYVRVTLCHSFCSILSQICLYFFIKLVKDDGQINGTIPYLVDDSLLIL